MIEIPLTQGKIALIDDEDFELVSKYKWIAAKDNCNVFYAKTQIKSYLGVNIFLGMHRLIMNATKDQLVDHINRNGLDNRKENLRLCTNTQNQHNKIGWSSSGYKGVSWYKRNKKWRVRIGNEHLGYYSDITEAAKAYDKKALELYGEFAYLNLLTKGDL